MADQVYEVQNGEHSMRLNAESAQKAAEIVFRLEHDGCLDPSDDGYSQTYQVFHASTGESKTFRVIYYNYCEATEIAKEEA